jgi:hypothetical protein
MDFEKYCTEIGYGFMGRKTNIKDNLVVLKKDD